MGFPLERFVPNVELLLALEPEELGECLLSAMLVGKETQLALSALHKAVVSQNASYKNDLRPEVGVALVEAVHSLVRQGLLIPGEHNWIYLSRRAQRMSAQDIGDLRFANILPRGILHPKIQHVWLSFMSRRYDDAVFQSMKAVEVHVRTAGKLPESALGVNLVRTAFHPENGPLTDKTAEGGERDARLALFAGAVGSYKNPHSHRYVDLNDPSEAAEIIMMANHLLRIVDSRIEATTQPVA